jgi:hypothetical protein
VQTKELRGIAAADLAFDALELVFGVLAGLFD